jgi:uncharacterized protein
MAVHVGRDRVFVDSGAWIALASARDQYHGEAVELFRKVVSRRQPLLTTNLVIAEVHRFVLQKVGIRAALLTIGKIESSAFTVIDFVGRDDHRKAVSWLENLPDQPITYTDAVSFVVMETRRCRGFIGFDHHFTVAGFRRWQPTK